MWLAYGPCPPLVLKALEPVLWIFPHLLYSQVNAIWQVTVGWAEGLALVGQGHRQLMGARGQERLGGGVSSLLTCVEMLNWEKGMRQMGGSQCLADGASPVKSTGRTWHQSCL